MLDNKIVKFGVILWLAVTSVFLIVYYMFYEYKKIKTTTNNKLNVQEKVVLNGQKLNSNSEEYFNNQIMEMFSLGREWLLNNIKRDGSFVYLYDKDGKEVSKKNNMIRQLLAFRVVAELCQGGEEKFCKIHQKNLKYIFNKKIYKTEDVEGMKVGKIVYDNVSKLGTNALLLRLLVASPYFDQYRDRAEEVINGIKYLQNEDGSFRPFFIEPTTKYDKEYKLNFYSGEAILALMEYYNKTGDEDIYKIAEKLQDYYLNKYVDNMDKNYYPAYAPWHIMSLNKFWQKTQKQRYTRAIFKLADELIKMQDRSKYLGRFYNPKHPEYGKPHSSSDAIYTESLVIAYNLAKELKDKKRQAEYFLAIKLATNNLAGLQFCNSESRFKKVDNKLCGAFQIRAGSRVSRMDSLAHTFEFMFTLKNKHQN